MRNPVTTLAPENTATKPSSSLSRLRLGMGTFIAIEAHAASLDICHAGVAAAYGVMTRIERLMHPMRGGSDLVALRESGPGVPIPVDPWTWAVLDLCRQLHMRSRGIFDPCVAGSPGRFRDLELRPVNRVIQHAVLHLDLGGIAKGYAVDRAVDALRHAGCNEGLVNAGGDVAVFGGREHTVWCRLQERSVAVKLQDAALCASDTLNASRPAEHRGYYHGAQRHAAVSGVAAVLAPRAAIADALTKCVLSGDDGVPALLDAYGARVIQFEAETAQGVSQRPWHASSQCP